MELFAADGHDAGGCERVTGKSGMRPRAPGRAVHLIGVEISAESREVAAFEAVTCPER